MALLIPRHSFLDAAFLEEQAENNTMTRALQVSAVVFAFLFGATASAWACGGEGKKSEEKDPAVSSASALCGGDHKKDGDEPNPSCGGDHKKDGDEPSPSCGGEGKKDGGEPHPSALCGGDHKKDGDEPNPS